MFVEMVGGDGMGMGFELNQDQTAAKTGRCSGSRGNAPKRSNTCRQRDVLDWIPTVIVNFFSCCKLDEGNEIFASCQDQTFKVEELGYGL